MSPRIFEALETGTAVVTGSARLSRNLHEEFAREQQARGKTAWPTPDILPWSAFLVRLWEDWLFAHASANTPLLLDRTQELAVWEMAIRGFAGDTLLDIRRTAQAAMETWALARGHRLALGDGRFHATAETEAFLSWARELERKCAEERWLDRASLPDFLGRRIRAGEVEIPPRLILAGFEDLTPQQRETLSASGGTWELEPLDESESASGYLAFADPEAELRAAAGWARDLLSRGVPGGIGVVVPDLQSQRSRVERIFQQTLDPQPFSCKRPLFHISLGRPLARAPVVHAALRLIEWAERGRMRLSVAGTLMRSPWIAGSQAEFSGRADTDSKLKRDRLWEIAPDDALLRTDNCPLLVHALKILKRTKWEGRRPASDWSRAFSRLLREAGWPGDRTLDSVEFQTLKAWTDLLSRFSGLDAVRGPLSAEEALEELRTMANDTNFQREDEGAPIQVMGLLEATGLRFGHLWIATLNHERFPQAASPNPFLPLSLQRERSLPHSSAEREFEYAGKTLRRLLGAARETVASYAQTEGDRQLKPTSILRNANWENAPAAPLTRVPAPIELVSDETGPLAEPGPRKGGARLLRSMSQCPFRAFAEYRLGAREIDEPEPGIGFLEKGSTVHKALELVWTELGGHADLVALTAEARQDLIHRATEQALHELEWNPFHAVERRRLERLLEDWLKFEAARDPFRVVSREEKIVADVAGLLIALRTDRVDALADGRHLLIDYKTGKVEKKAWQGDRPTEPQLPLYCAKHEQPLAGAALAQVRTGELEMLYAGDFEKPHDWKAMNVDERNFAAQVARWKEVIEKLAADFREGVARVDPKSPKVCEQCGVMALCRIRDEGFPAETGGDETSG